MSSLQERNQVKLQSPHTVFQMFETPFKQFGKDIEFVEGNNCPGTEMLEELKGLVMVQHSEKSCCFNVPSTQVFHSLM